MPSIAERIFGRRGERRALTPNQMWGSDFSWPDANPSGERINQHNATTLATVYACQTLIADMISTLPVHVMRSDGGYPVPLDPEPTWLTTPVPNDPTVTRSVHFGQLAMSLVADGNAFIHASPHVYDPKVLTVLDPATVRIERDRETLRPKYHVRYRNQQETFTADNIVHIPRTMRAGDDRGLSPIDEAAMTLGTYMAATKHAGRFYRNGALLQTILEVPGEMSEVDAKALRDSFDEAHTGENVFKTGVLSGGAKATTMGVTPEQAQFLDTLKHGTIEVCRMFRVPPILVGVNEPGTVSYASSVEAVKAFARNTLAPFLRPVELAYGRLLDDDTYLRFDMNGLLRADPEARYAGYAIGVDKGFLSRDEARAWEELPPIGGKAGSMYTVQAQMVDLAQVADPPPPPPQLAPAVNPPTDPTPEPDDKRYSPDQPRVPGGNPDGGQFTDAGGSGGAAADKARLEAAGYYDTAGLEYMEPGLRSEVVATLEQLAKDYPDTASTTSIVVSPLRSLAVFAETSRDYRNDDADSSTITFNQDIFAGDASISVALRADLAQSSRRGWMVDGTVRGVVNHEFGHALANAQPEHFLDLGLDLAPTGPQPSISGYASAGGPNERFAETFAAVQIGTSYLSSDFFTWEGSAEELIGTVKR